MDLYIGLAIGLVLAGLSSYFYIKSKQGNHTLLLQKVKELEEDLDDQSSKDRELLEKQARISEELRLVKVRNLTLEENLKDFQTRFTENQNTKASLIAKLESSVLQTGQLKESLKLLEGRFLTKEESYNKIQRELATLSAEKNAALEKLDTQKQEIEGLQKKFNLEFEQIASKILEQKTARFTETNKENLKQILSPLNKDIESFKKRVDEVYMKESQERFSLGERVKELQELNQSISQEARNLTNALKGEVKTQGRWGEMILERILEKSGLRKGEEYFLEKQLEDESGKALRSDASDKKMRPDALINYPDNRTVIIDSKVSLNAFTRAMDAEEEAVRTSELDDHVNAIKTHILALSKKGYDDYDKALDFVMMFIPSEAAYVAALKHDSNLWEYAYDKRILLLNPTNLITSLKLIEDLWKRERQNENTQAIADRGSKLYDKFVGFVSNLDRVGDYMEKAQNSYKDAYSQLSTGNDNLVRQANKLKELGVKTKKSLPNHLLDIDSE
jgi:DNA recombination protein RmuC